MKFSHQTQEVTFRFVSLSLQVNSSEHLCSLYKRNKKLKSFIQETWKKLRSQNIDIKALDVTPFLHIFLNPYSLRPFVKLLTLLIKCLWSIFSSSSMNSAFPFRHSTTKTSVRQTPTTKRSLIFSFQLQELPMRILIITLRVFSFLIMWFNQKANTEGLTSLFSFLWEYKKEYSGVVYKLKKLKQYVHLVLTAHV